MKYYFNLLIHCFNVCTALKEHFKDTPYPLKPVRFFCGEFRRLSYDRKLHLENGWVIGDNWDYRTWTLIKIVRSWENPNISWWK